MSHELALKDAEELARRDDYFLNADAAARSEEAERLAYEQAERVIRDKHHELDNFIHEVKVNAERKGAKSFEDQRETLVTSFFKLVGVSIVFAAIFACAYVRFMPPRHQYAESHPDWWRGQWVARQWVSSLGRLP